MLSTRASVFTGARVRQLTVMRERVSSAAKRTSAWLPETDRSSRAQPWAGIAEIRSARVPVQLTLT